MLRPSINLNRIRPLRYPTNLKRTFIRNLGAFLAKDSYVTILAPWYTDNTFPAGDGYLQRIRVIDSRLFVGHRRVYIYNSPFWTAAWIGCFLVDDSDARYLIYNDSDSGQCASVMQIIGKASLCYIHSVYRLLASIPSQTTSTFIKPSAISCKKILDLHGFISAELSMSNAPVEKIRIAQAAEKSWLANADCIVSVTQSMLTCSEEAYSIHARNAIILPIMGAVPNTDPSRNWVKASDSDAPVILYSGGLQVWQQVDEMIRLAETTPIVASYRFFVSDPGEMHCILAEKQAVRAYHVDSLLPEALCSEYDHADFGFMLRQESLVNKVACPTKLIDYLFHGVIPIVHSTDIGDFFTCGMQYVTDVEFAAGHLPDATARNAMREKNLMVVRLIAEAFSNGLIELECFIIEHINKHDIATS